MQICACTWYMHAYIFKKKNLDLGKSDLVGRPETRIFLVGPYEELTKRRDFFPNSFDNNVQHLFSHSQSTHHGDH